MAADPLAAARTIAPLAAQLAPEGERARRLAPRVLAALAEADLFRLCVPLTYGGLEADPTVAADTVQTLARADGATGWCVAVGATSGLLSAYLDPAGAREVFGRRGGVAGGVFAPMGSAVAEGTGWRVSGRWPFASGCEHCDWLMGGCTVADGTGGVRRLAGGAPETLLALIPAEEVQIIDTWSVAGLRATGSHDIAVQDRLIPASHAASVFTDRPRVSGALYAFPLFGLLAVSIGAVILGIARGALDDIERLAGAKAPAGGKRKLAERSTVQAHLARAEAAVSAARALVHESIGAAWGQARADGQITVPARAALRRAATHAAETGVAVTGACFHLGGGSAVYESSPLQRRLRDASVAGQHMLVAPSTWELTGRLLLALETDLSQL